MVTGGEGRRTAHQNIISVRLSLTDLPTLIAKLSIKRERIGKMRILFVPSHLLRANRCSTNDSSIVQKKLS
jgi:hypothetical protein